MFLSQTYLPKPVKAGVLISTIMFFFLALSAAGWAAAGDIVITVTDELGASVSGASFDFYCTGGAVQTCTDGVSCGDAVADGTINIPAASIPAGASCDDADSFLQQDVYKAGYVTDTDVGLTTYSTGVQNNGAGSLQFTVKITTQNELGAPITGATAVITGGLTVTDGGAGDGDAASNGIIYIAQDPSGLGAGPHTITVSLAGYVDWSDATQTISSSSQTAYTSANQFTVKITAGDVKDELSNALTLASGDTANLYTDSACTAGEVPLTWDAGTSSWYYAAAPGTYYAKYGQTGYVDTCDSTSITASAAAQVRPAWDGAADGLDLTLKIHVQDGAGADVTGATVKVLDGAAEIGTATEIGSGDYLYALDPALDDATALEIEVTKDTSTQTFTDVIDNEVTSTAQWTETVTVDYADPTPSLSLSDTSIVIGSKITITCTATDDIDTDPTTSISVEKPDGSSVSSGAEFSDTTAIGTYTVTCSATDDAGNSDSTTATFTSVSVSGGAGAAAPTPAVTTSQTWASVDAGATVTHTVKKEEVGVTEVSITVENAASNVKVTTTKLDAKPTAIVQEVVGKVYKYVEIETQNLAAENIKDAVIKFAVLKTWIADNNIDKNIVVLNRFTTSWEELPTSILTEDETNVYYTATTPGFSVFAVSGQELAPEEVPEEEVPPEEVPPEEVPPEEVPEEVPPAVPVWPISPVYIAAIGVAIVAIAVGAVAIKKGVHKEVSEKVRRRVHKEE